ncbi:MAG: protein kinase [Deltaproteobacteria bacterium]|nr:protein kinase [Deltaproteobacteria bacterium]
MGEVKSDRDELTGRVLAGRYRLGARLGEGGMGVVYEAIHLQLGRRVAVKTILEIGDPRDIARLHDEAMTAASLSHPCIVQVTDFGAADGDAPPFLVMELLNGESLSARLAREGKLPVDRAAKIVLQLLAALAAAHDARILHRDVKPSNVFLVPGVDGSEPMVKVVDFGIAKFQDDASKRTTTGKVVGTLAYMAPEVLRGKPATASSDLYAAGVCLFEMLTGKRPFDGRRKDFVEAIVGEEAPNVRALEPSVPKAVADVVARALRKKPELRFESAKAMADAIRAATSAGDREPMTETIPEGKAARTPSVGAAATSPTAPAPSRSVFAIAALGSIAVGALALVVLLVRAAATRPPPGPTLPASSNAPTVAGDAAPATPSATTDEAGAPDEAVSSSATSAPAPKPVPCVCFAKDGGFLCPVLERYCSCKSDDGSVLAMEFCPAASGCKYEFYRGYAPHPAQGERCDGFYVYSAPESKRLTPKPGSGTFECGKQCNKIAARAKAPLAVPGTPCEGLAYEGPKVRGVWKPIPPDFGK